MAYKFNTKNVARTVESIVKKSSSIRDIEKTLQKGHRSTTYGDFKDPLEFFIAAMVLDASTDESEEFHDQFIYRLYSEDDSGEHVIRLDLNDYDYSVEYEEYDD